MANDDLIQSQPGYFKFGPDLICYGRSALSTGQKATDSLPDAFGEVQRIGAVWILPFDPTEVADNLRYERYVVKGDEVAWKKLIRKLYYALRPVLPVAFRRHLQRVWLERGGEKTFPQWPVDRSVDQMFERLMALAAQSSPDSRIPFIWFWPEGKSSCAIMTHDVETAAGLRFTGKLMDIAEAYGIRSSFQLIPAARYVVDTATLSMMKDRGFEVNVHDLKHDGHLFDTHQQFQKAASRISDFAVEFGSKGFRAGALYRNQEWFDGFRLAYDMSVPNVGHLDPQSGGCCTVMPYFVGKLLEIPVTTTQDYSLFNIIGTYSIELWTEQIEKILKQHGLISFIIHPDYLDCPEALEAYKKLLDKLVELRSGAELWICLPGEVDSWWRQRSEMTLVAHENCWRIEGDGAERARVAYADVQNGEVRYTFQ
ncbi:hypothetical protein [Granulicella sp. dw_53]|uniref:hypothetical protein n=1 Tax=Granulicella sp. dw_53 TaxID=2719792 RepID=UPI001BD22394|nr:hypothetical protein [Granulicella sp. dw_53]